MIQITTQTKLEGVDFAFVKLKKRLLCDVVLNDDGTVPETLKQSVDYNAVAHAFKLSMPNKTQAYLDTLTPTERNRYQTYYINAVILRKEWRGW